MKYDSHFILKGMISNSSLVVNDNIKINQWSMNYIVLISFKGQDIIAFIWKEL